MLQADEARKKITKLPVRRSRRLGQFAMAVNFAERARAKETVLWLHEVHGDVATGKEKKEIRRELGYSSEGGDGEGEGLDPTEVTGAEGTPGKKAPSTKHLETEVEFGEVRRLGMPLSYLDGLSDVIFTIRGQATKDLTVVTRWEVHGLHTGELLGVPPTGRDVTTHGMTLIRFDQGPNPDGPGRLSHALEEWTYWDLPALAQQIGARL
jgi:hypothetical protein